MGCDIHTHVEYYGMGSQEWIDCDHYRRNEYYSSYEDEEEFRVIEVCGNRNYGLFAVLADVRNYAKAEYIDEPRGIPKDCNEHIKKDFERWKYDAHSASYFTLKELMDFYEKHPKKKVSGLVSSEQAKELDEKGVLPTSYCQWTNMEGYVRRVWEVDSPLKLLIDELKERLEEVIYSYNEEHLDKIRFVFWFDN